MQLTNREMDVMQILWESQESLMVSEIVQRDKGSTVYSVQRVIKNLLKKDMVMVDGYGVIKKTMGRKFKATADSKLMGADIVNDLMFSLGNIDMVSSNLVANLTTNCSDEENLKKLEELEKIICERKEAILHNMKMNR